MATRKGTGDSAAAVQARPPHRGATTVKEEPPHEAAHADSAASTSTPAAPGRPRIKGEAREPPGHSGRTEDEEETRKLEEGKLRERERERAQEREEEEERERGGGGRRAGGGAGMPAAAITLLFLSAREMTVSFPTPNFTFEITRSLFEELDPALKRQVSRTHCRFVFPSLFFLAVSAETRFRLVPTADEYMHELWVDDLSLNGTVLNNCLIGKPYSRRVKHNDIIGIVTVKNESQDGLKVTLGMRVQLDSGVEDLSPDSQSISCTTITSPKPPTRLLEGHTAEPPSKEAPLLTSSPLLPEQSRNICSAEMVRSSESEIEVCTVNPPKVPTKSSSPKITKRSPKSKRKETSIKSPPNTSKLLPEIPADDPPSDNSTTIIQATTLSSRKLTKHKPSVNSTPEPRVTGKKHPPPGPTSNESSVIVPPAKKNRVDPQKPNYPARPSPHTSTCSVSSEATTLSKPKSQVNYALVGYTEQEKGEQTKWPKIYGNYVKERAQPPLVDVIVLRKQFWNCPSQYSNEINLPLCLRDSTIRFVSSRDDLKKLCKDMSTTIPNELFPQKGLKGLILDPDLASNSELCANLDTLFQVLTINCRKVFTEILILQEYDTIFSAPPLKAEIMKRVNPRNQHKFAQLPPYEISTAEKGLVISDLLCQGTMPPIKHRELIKSCILLAFNKITKVRDLIFVTDNPVLQDLADKNQVSTASVEQILRRRH
ncbi:hypothetical protein Pelo_17677 [Pelomyxa schiedti]|nr:hypothetical protein Pelo_17677 [Pelomyxa schiedti]